MTEPRVRLISGKPVTCRTCRYVMNPRFPLRVHGGEFGYRADCFEVVCCRVAPPTKFRWTNTQIEPFCGQHEPDEGTAPADPRLEPLVVRERVERSAEHPIFDDEAMIPMYGTPVPPEKVPPGLRRKGR